MKFRIPFRKSVKKNGGVRETDTPRNNVDEGDRCAEIHQAKMSGMS
jgi:hypothetical protein